MFAECTNSTIRYRLQVKPKIEWATQEKINFSADTFTCRQLVKLFCHPLRKNLKTSVPKTMFFSTLDCIPFILLINSCHCLPSCLVHRDQCQILYHLSTGLSIFISICLLIIWVFILLQLSSKSSFTAFGFGASSQFDQNLPRQSFKSNINVNVAPASIFGGDTMPEIRKYMKSFKTEIHCASFWGKWII